ncbi:MAG: hypothetical protein GXY03_11750 [Solirubrobacterales bacterium]|nr:hypothetical protein [Solirubrobacterales bacterium]
MPELRGIAGGSDAGAGVAAAVEELAAGRLVVLVAGDAAHLVAAGPLATTHAMVTMAAYGHGVLRVTLAPERLAELGIPALGDEGYHAPVDLRGHDRSSTHAGRAATVRALASEAAVAADLCSPGHVFPVACAAGGVLERAAAAEAAADLARSATGVPAAVLVGAVDEGGAPGDRAAAGRLARTLGLRIVTVAELVAYRRRVEPAVERMVAAELPTRDGDLTAIAFRSLRGGREYTAFVRGEPDRRGVRVHVHLACQPGDVFGGAVCDCGTRLRAALADIAAAGHGVVVHSEHPEPFRHLKGTVGAPLAELELDVAHLLRQLGVRDAAISANEPIGLTALEAAGVRAGDPADAAARRAAGS